MVVDGIVYPLDSQTTVMEFINRRFAPVDIDFIEVLRGAEAAIYGVRGGYGVISINTRHGGYDPSDIKSNMRFISPVTYHTPPTFEMADYSNDAIKNNTDPDLRTTIYWNGNLAVDAKGQADIHFYTSDKPSNYTITVTGLTASGEIVYKQATITNSGMTR